MNSRVWRATRSGLHVDAGRAGFHGGPGHGLGHRRGHPEIHGLGQDIVRAQSLPTRAAMAWAAAMFMASLMARARMSRAPRKMPGKARQLFTWLGKSDRPVATTWAPAALAASG